jgi:hypothetical protein
MSRLHFNIRLLFRFVVTIPTLIVVTACSSSNYQHPSIEQVAQEYFETYAERSNFDQFMVFYDDAAELRDIVYGNYLPNKMAIQGFLDWNRGTFKPITGDKILTITQQVREANTVVTQGYFHAFEYDGALLGPWLFSITLEFNDAGKIIKQTDWINYTPRDQFLGGENMNSKLIKDK